MDIDTLRQRVASHRAITVAGDVSIARAAVALIVRDAPDGAQLLAIQRAERDGDPWSGHMALPGGRSDPSDRDCFATAVREAHEEVGVDLAQDGRLLGQLDELQAVGRGKVLPLVITPIAYELMNPTVLTLNQAEVGAAIWIPVRELREPATQGHFAYELEGVTMRHPAYVYEGYTIWGLTYRILTNLLGLLD